MKVLVKCFGFMGDVIYASSMAKKLKEQGFDKVTYLNGIRQATGLLERNPYIDTVLTTAQPTTDTTHISIDEQFDRVILVKQCMFVDPPAIQMQKDAGIPDPSPEFTLYTDPSIDESVKKFYGDTPYLTVMELTSWRRKSFLFTHQEYITGNDIPDRGFGGHNRNVELILNSMRDTIQKEHPDFGDVNVIYVGAPPEHSTLSLPFSNSHRSLDVEASIIKHSVAFIGAEGGLANVAAGVGTRTILTYDYVHQLYGWNGTVRKTLPEPKLGPRYYFPDVPHVDINPYLTDEEAGVEIGRCVCEDYSGKETGRIFIGPGEVRHWL